MEIFVCVDCLKEISATDKRLNQLWVRNNTDDVGATIVSTEEKLTEESI